MISANKVLMLIRREFWENRSLWIAPLVISGVILVTTLFGGIHVNGDGNEHMWFSGAQHHMTAEQLDPGATKRQMIYASTIGAFTVVQLITLGVVVFFYLLDSLLAERKDRSILFWKSLPISDTEVVASKALTGMVVTPLYVLAVSAVTQLVFGLIWWARFSNHPLGTLVTPFDAGMWLQVQAAFLVLVPAVVVWYLPIAGYLMLVSVWSRRNAFLWAVLPWVALQLIEAIITHTHHVADFLGRRFAGMFMVMDFPRGDLQADQPLASFLAHVSRVFIHPETWLGVLAAAAFLVAVIRIRRYRDDS
jgi:ABC-2 type transport system permease protein